MPSLDMLDLRTRHRYLRKGGISQKEVDQYLSDLPDVASNAEWIDYEKLFEQQLAEERAQPAPKPAPLAPRAPVSAAPAQVAADDADEDEDEDDADLGAES